MSITLKAYANCSNVFLVWQAAKKFPNCLGFSVQRKENGIDDVLQSSVGFGDMAPGPNNPSVNPGSFKPTTQWPLQRFTWTDFTVQTGQTIQYRIVPMIGTEQNLQPDETSASLWSDSVTLAGDVNGAVFSSYFNDGVLATQWIARQLQNQPSMSNSIRKDIAEKGNPIRVRLGGPVLKKLIELLEQADNAGAHIYAALFELNDIEVVPLLQSLGARAHIVLANGSTKGNDDENSSARAQLKASGVDVRDRMLKSGHLGHNKFLVICSNVDTPQKVWTGSTNMTLTGLCTQANNALLINHPGIARLFKDQWDVLANAGSAFPPRPISQTLRKLFSIGPASVTTSFTPWPGTKGKISTTQPKDLAYAKQLIQQAKNGILFLQFMPGPVGTLLEAISARNKEANFYVRGVVNQDPGTAKNPVVGLFHQGEAIPATFDVILPEAIDRQISYWDPEIKKIAGAHAIVHSKLVVLDPFGDKPVVMTGSHNQGTKASLSNDENLVIIENDADLARQFAVNIITIFNQYWWRYNRMKPSDRVPAQYKAKAESFNDSAFRHMLTQTTPMDVWSGLRSDDAWQDQYFSGSRLVELAFWLGASFASGGSMPSGAIESIAANSGATSPAVDTPITAGPAITKKPKPKATPRSKSRRNPRQGKAARTPGSRPRRKASSPAGSRRRTSS